MGVTITEIGINIYQLLQNPNPYGLYFRTVIITSLIDPLENTWGSIFLTNKAEYDRLGYEDCFHHFCFFFSKRMDSEICTKKT
jgi:hypothetical protein